MKKIKISQLPICTDLKGLYTIGSDKDNRSVKVPFDFVDEVVSKAETAAQKAEAAATKAETAVMSRITDADIDALLKK